VEGRAYLQDMNKVSIEFEVATIMYMIKELKDITKKVPHE
jgi:hypothetical protein